MRACCAHGFRCCYAERTFGFRLGGLVIPAQLAGESRHGKKIGIAGMRGFEPIHMRAKARPHMLLAEHVVEKLGEFRAQEIARPLRRDRLHGLDRAQVVVGLPERERPIKRALARIHG